MRKRAQGDLPTSMILRLVIGSFLMLMTVLISIAGLCILLDKEAL